MTAPTADANGWLPIESAPRDGTEFQAWMKAGYWEPRCQFNPETGAFECWGWDNGMGCDAWDASTGLHATHWMPQPTPPTSEAGDG